MINQQTETKTSSLVEAQLATELAVSISGGKTQPLTETTGDSDNNTLIIRTVLPNLFYQGTFPNKNFIKSRHTSATVRDINSFVYQTSFIQLEILQHLFL